MKVYISIIIVTCVLLISSCNCSPIKNCLKTLPKSWDEQPIIDHVKKCVENPESYIIDVSLMSNLQKKGYFKSSDFLQKNHYIKNGINIGQELRNDVAFVKKSLDQILEDVSHIKKIHKITPVFKWGQSYSEIKIFFKFAHRFDSPGCLDIKETQLKVNKQNFVRFTTKCLHGNSPTLFDLEIKLKRKLKWKEATWNKDSVGTAVLTIPKKKEKIWIALLDEKWKKPAEMKVTVWWDLKYMFKDAMTEYERLIDEADDDDELWGIKKDDDDEEEDEGDDEEEDSVIKEEDKQKNITPQNYETTEDLMASSDTKNEEQNKVIEEDKEHIEDLLSESNQTDL